MTGKFRQRDWDGQPFTEGKWFERKNTWIAGGLFAVVWIIRPDMEWIQNSLELEGASCVHICPWCRANTVEDEQDEWAAMFDVPVAPWSDIMMMQRGGYGVDIS